MKLYVWDLETTGVDIKECGAVQFGAVLVHEPGGEPEVVADTLAKPCAPITREAADVHGITQSMCEGFQPDHEIAAELLEDILKHENVVTAGHNLINFDVKVLERLTGIPYHLPVIDTYVLAVRLYPDLDNHRLGELTKMFDLGDAAGAHDAVADVKMVAKLVDKFCGVTGMNWLQLADWCETPQILETIHFGKHKGKHWQDMPLGYLNFILQKFDPSQDMVATVRHYFKKEFKNA